MKIVFFTDFYRPSLEGVTASIDLFADSLRSRGHRVWIVAPAPAQPLADEHPDVIRLPSMPSVWYRGGTLRDSILTPYYGKLIRELKADVFHFHTLGTTGLAGMRLMHDLQVRSVAQYHTDMEQYAKVYRGMWLGMLVINLVGPVVVNKVDAWPDTLSGMKPKRNLKAWNETMIRNLIRVCYENFDQIVAPSKKMESLLLEYGVTQPVTIIPTGINPDEFPLLPTKVAYTSKRPFRLLYVGRVAQEKNVDLLIKMMARLKKVSQHPIKLTIIGPGPHLAAIRKQVVSRSLQQMVELKGGLPRHEALASYNEADAFVFPSLTDTQALVLNEAAYSGLPLLFSDESISHIAQPDKTGFLVEPTADTYAEAVLKLMKDQKLRQELGENAHKIAKRATSLAQAGKLERVYEKALQR